MSRLGTPNPLPVTVSDDASIDAFNRSRVSNPTTVFDSKQINDKQPLFWDDQEVSGTGTSSTYSQNAARTRIAVGATTAGKRVRQTFMRFNYQPGKSQLVFMTGVLGNAGTGITAAMGQFDDDNGIFATSEAGVVSFVVRSNVTGTPVDTAVAQTSWNLDNMDGTGPSGKTLDETKTHILVMDYEWLGVGRVRIGWAMDGIVYYCHEFLHANVLDVVYMSTPNLPLRYSIENDGTGAASHVDHICATVITEGGQQDLGVLRHTDSGSVAGLATGTLYAMIGIRLKAANLGAVIDIINASLLCSSNNDLCHWELLLNPTVAGTFTYADMTDSSVQVATGAAANTVTGGIAIDGGYFTTSQATTAQANNAIRLGAAIDDTVDEIVLCAKPVTNNITVYASTTWRELS